MDTCSAHFPLPASAWWIDFYLTLLIRLPVLEHQCKGNAEAEAIISVPRQEIEIFEEYSVKVRVLPA